MLRNAALTNTRCVEKSYQPPLPLAPTPLCNCLCVGEQVSLVVTDTELRSLLTDGADFLLKSIWSRNSSVSIVTRPRVGPLGPTVPLFQWVLWAFCAWECGRVMKIAIHPHQVLRLRMCGAKPALPCFVMTPSDSCSVERNFEYFRGAHWVRWQSRQHCYQQNILLLNEGTVICRVVSSLEWRCSM